MSIIINALKNGQKAVRYFDKNQNNVQKFYRQQKISQSEPNLMTDKFFRQDELYNKSIDNVHKGYRVYDTDDLPVYDYTQTDRDIDYLFAQQRPFIEYKNNFIKLRKDNRVVDLDKVYMSNLNNSSSNIISEKLNEGYDVEHVLNVLYSSRINGVLRNNLADSGFSLLRRGYPIETVIELMEKSKLRRKNGTKKYSEGMLEFLEQFPDLRHLVVSKNRIGEEMFDKYGAKNFPYLFDLAKDEQTAVKIFKDCQVYNPYDGFVVDDLLCNSAFHILRRSGEYTKNDAKLMNILRQNVRKDCCYDVEDLLARGEKSEDILKNYFNLDYFEP